MVLGRGARGRVAAALRTPQGLLSAVWLGLVGVVLLSLPIPRPDGLMIGSDGIGYFANLHSLLFDGDLRLGDEYLRLAPDQVPSNPDVPKYTIGLPVLWAPFYLVAHAVATLLNGLGVPIAADGYGLGYEAAVCLGTMVYGYLGMLLTYRVCREFVDWASALLSTLVVWLGTGVVYYLVIENSMSHIASIAVTTALVGWWLWGRERGRLAYWGGMGVLVGVAAMIRPQDVVFAVIPAFALVWRPPNREARWLADAGRNGLLLVGGFAAGYLPQAIVSTLVYGSPVAVGYLERGEGFSWGSPHLPEVLFSTRHGLFTWHPIFLVAAAGLLVLTRRQPRVALALSAAVAAEVFVVASWHVWWGGDAFGARLLLSCLPALAIGLAEAISRLRETAPRWLVPAGAGLALVWNFLFVLQYFSHSISYSDPIGWDELTVGKLTIVPQLLARL